MWNENEGKKRFHRNQDVDIDFTKHEQTLQRIKRGVLPDNPKSIDELNAKFSEEEIKKKFGQSIHTESNIFNGAVHSEKHSFCVFSSKPFIDLMQNHIGGGERHILMDATFRICPVGSFKQLLVLYVRKYQKVSFFFSLLLLFCLFSLFID